MKTIGPQIPDEIDLRMRKEIIPLITGDKRPGVSLAVTAALLALLDLDDDQKRSYIRAAAIAKIDDESRNL